MQHSPAPLPSAMVGEVPCQGTISEGWAVNEKHSRRCGPPPPTRSSPEWEIGTTRALPLASVWTLTMENAVILQYNTYPK